MKTHYSFLDPWKHKSFLHFYFISREPSVLFIWVNSIAQVSEENMERLTFLSTPHLSSVTWTYLAAEVEQQNCLSSSDTEVVVSKDNYHLCRNSRIQL